MSKLSKNNNDNIVMQRTVCVITKTYIVFIENNMNLIDSLIK